MKYKYLHIGICRCNCLYTQMYKKKSHHRIRSEYVETFLYV